MVKNFAMIPGEALADPAVSPAALRVLGIISYQGGNKPKGCWHSVKSLADIVGVTRRQLSAHTASLEAAGYLVKEETRGFHGGLGTNIYRVLFDKKTSSPSRTPTAKPPAIELHELSTNRLHHPPEAKLHDKKRTKQNRTKQLEPDRKRKPALISLDEWENKIGSKLRFEMVSRWTTEKKFCPSLIAEMIEEFRTEIKAKGKLYADFRATFQVWVMKGYLSKKPAQLLLTNSPYGKASFKDKEFKHGVSL